MAAHTHLRGPEPIMPEAVHTRPQATCAACAAKENAQPVPRMPGPGCSWTGAHPDHCTVHDSPLVAVPMPNSGSGTGSSARVRMCRAHLAAAADYTPPPPGIAAQLGPVATAALRRLPDLDDHAVDQLVDAFYLGRYGDAVAVPATVRRHTADGVRAVLQRLAAEADQ